MNDVIYIDNPFLKNMPSIRLVVFIFFLILFVKDLFWVNFARAETMICLTKLNLERSKVKFEIKKNQESCGENELSLEWKKQKSGIVLLMPQGSDILLEKNKEARVFDSNTAPHSIKEHPQMD